jgi:hypothetical protein
MSFKLYYGVNCNAAGTLIGTISPTSVTKTTAVAVSITVPAGNQVWAIVYSVTMVPHSVVFVVKGHGL